MIRFLQRARRDERGFTLIEALVALGLFGILASILFSVVMNGATMLRGTRQQTDLNEESRLLLNRISRELREASSITSVINPGGSTYDATGDTSLTFEVDFNGNGVIEPDATDPERLTYKYEYAAKKVSLQTTTLTYPILAENVELFKISYYSQRFECDVDKDGIVTWEEVESAPNPCPDLAGDSDSPPSLDVELGSVNSVVVELTVLTGNRRQNYRTQVDMRNRPF